MKMKWSLLGVLIVLFAGLLAVSVQAVPVSLQYVEVDGDEVYSGDTNPTHLDRGQEFEVRVRLDALEDIQNLEITAFISGYEYNDYESISDTTHIFDAEKGYHTAELNLRLPDRVEEDQYKLRVIISDRNGYMLAEDYQLELNPTRVGLKVRDVVFSPQEQVTAGRALLTSVLVKNIGDKDMDSVKVKVSIPALGVSATDYIDEIVSEDSVLSEEIYMRIPKDAETDQYSMKVLVEYDEGFEEVTAQRSVFVEAVEDYKEPAPAEKQRTVITISTDVQELKSGQGGAVYPITLSNEGTSSKTYVVSVEGTQDWATYRISPSNVVVLGPKETSTVYVYLAAKDVEAGSRIFTVTVSAADKMLKQLPMTASVVEDEDSSVIGGLVNVRRALEIGFIVLVIVLVVLAIIVGFSLIRRGKEPDEISGQTYY